KQALAVDPQFFVKYPMTTLVSVDERHALGSQYPEGMHAYMRAPFFALQNNNAKLTDFISRYRAKFNGEYPSDWAVMDYDAFMLWAQAANSAKGFDADQVVKQISGHAFDSLRGYKITIRPDELQANVGETTGTTTSSGGAYPFPILKDVTNLKGDDLLMPLQMVNEVKGNQCDAVAVAGAIGGVVEVLVLRRVYGREHLVQLLGTYAVSLIIAGAVRIVFGANYRTIVSPIPGHINLGGYSYASYSLFMIAAAIA